MQQHQGGGSQYGAAPPDMGPFSPTHASAVPLPLSSRPPPPPAASQTQPQPPPQQQQLPRASYDELAAASSAGAGGFPEDDMLGDAGGSGGGGGSGAGGNRWPREETLALIRIRSEMDATFRDATLKGPLWEEVSRKLAELGYKRSAKKCKEKFENVHKYYKRTKEGRAGRQDGKSYRFFSELEALHATAPQTPQPQQQLPPVSSGTHAMHAFAPTVSAPPPMSSMPPPPGPIQPAPISSAAPAVSLELPPQPLINLQGFSFSSMSGSESDDESEDDEMTAETGGSQDHLGKRKRGAGGKKLTTFFEGLIKQVVDRQEEMQRRFLETMEKREAERTAREEAWRRQEVARLNREQEQLAQERAAAASRDAAVISFLQRIGGQSAQVPPVGTVVQMPTPVQLQTPPLSKQPAARQHQPQTNPPPPAPIPAAPLQQQPPQPQHKETTHHEAVTPRSAPPTSGSSLEVVPAAEQLAESGLGGEGGSASSSRWPKTEVHALIQLRMELDMRYQETGPKGPLWEEISGGMRRLGYNRSSKRCKEKWENINKYFKKVKESNKKRADDSKTCPYFHQLDAIYRRKHLTGGGGGASSANVAGSVAATTLDQQNPNRHEIEGKNINDSDKRNNGGAQVPTSNGDTAPTTATFDVDRGMKKPEDIVRELSEQPPREFTTDETDSDDMGDDYTDDGEEGEDDGKMQYRIQFQRPNTAGANTAPPPATTPASAVPTSTPTSTFLAMVQ
ncbi:trihelix transcription factor GTL1-like isoform X2 [Oryza brachyantha]|uniref:trihelix transcription factor GTL1-like isoform X2 n=1 Tax=Oryza brachyantha TaxID=4533 RepID=UPI001ADA2082|nr:trihelix transcription factor GTL1-like isoform X2 [Oryza brachyantha]